MPNNVTTISGFATVLVLLAGYTPSSASDFNAEDLAFFESKIRPVLVENCYKCHSADSKKLKAGLLLDRRSGHLEGGDIGPAVDLEKPAESLLLETLNYQTEDLEMPPAGKLDDAIIADFEKWIALGAPWPEETAKDASAVTESFDLETRQAEHWCWQPIADPDAPEVERVDWALNELDRFVLAKIEDAGFVPSAEAEPLTWLRRVTFDLTGLPPTLEEIAAFRKHPDYPAAVDRLLSSPRFGERWARHWMDLARFAETAGHEFDFPIKHAYRYRDYLIDAFNQDVPYDQFLTEQIAGDLLPKPRRNPQDKTNASIVGTGFWFFHEAVHAPTDIRGDEADRIDNQIDVFGKSFLGLTIACARCHDHKFDAIGTADYYAIAGYLQSSRRQTAMLDPQGKIQSGIDRASELQAEAQAFVRENGVFDLTKGKPSQYLAALPILKAAAAESEDERMVFEDFEDGAPDWIADGIAFADGAFPGTRSGQQKVSGFAGEKTINSFVKGDRSQGTLTSPEFVISHPVIEFLIGGGNHKGKTCANLLIDGEVVRSTTGAADEMLKPSEWDVSQFEGKKAKIQLVDNETGGWGHVNFDHVVFSGGTPIPDGVFEKVSREQGLDREILKRWADLDEEDLKLIIAGEIKNPGESFEDFDNGLPEGWSSTGYAFPSSPTQEVTWADGQLLTPGVVSSGITAAKAQGILRSPTFELKHTSIYIRTKASGGGPKVRLVIDEHHMNNFHTLLLKGTILKSKELVNEGKGWAWHRMTGNLDKYIGHRAYLEISDEGEGAIAIDEIRFSNEPFHMKPERVIERERFDELVSGTLEGEDSITVANFALRNGLLNEFPELTALRQKLAAIEIPAPTRAIALTEGNPENEHVHIRGAHQSKGDLVPRRNLVALGGQLADDAAGSGRLALAENLTSEQNPLVRRVIVNRLWHQLFGRGIVPTVDDFGVMGQAPSHPKLLDHLATKFSETHHWSIKSMLKTLVLSSTYRMSSTINPENDLNQLAAADPENILLTHAPVRRLQAEAIRDSVLAVSGGLKNEIGGPSVPIYLTSFMEGRGRPNDVGPLDGEGRRSLYLETRRNFLNPFMLTFDQPSPFNAMGRRTVSNVPAQALTLMNDPLIEQQSQQWGERIASGPGEVDEKLDRLFLTAFTREATAREKDVARSFLGDRPDQMAWSDLCHALINKKEFIFLN